MTPLLHHGEPVWSLEIFRVSSRRRQRRVLEALHAASAAGVQSLGLLRDTDCFVIVDVMSIADLIAARRVIVGVDPSATHVHSSGPRSDTDVPAILAGIVTV